MQPQSSGKILHVGQSPKKVLACLRGTEARSRPWICWKQLPLESGVGFHSFGFCAMTQPGGELASLFFLEERLAGDDSRPDDQMMDKQLRQRLALKRSSACYRHTEATILQQAAGSG